MSGNNKIKWFVKDNGVKLPVSDDFLLPFLSPTSKSTYFRDPPPEGSLFDRQKGRILLQSHQALHLLKEYGIGLKDKAMLDIGTGNGLIPRMLLELSDLESAVGTDPYLDGELPVSWQVHDHDEALMEIKTFIEERCDNCLDYDRYKHLLQHENHTMIPGKLRCRRSGAKRYRFVKIGAHELGGLEEKFDLIYCKAIEHIQNWDGFFEAASAVAQENAVMYLKHRPFFSYLGAHRRASISIPWGHLLLTDAEYRRFVREYYSDDAESMISFYFGGLNYPRTTVSEMVEYARGHGFIPVVVIAEPTRHIKTVSKLIDDIKYFWAIVVANHPRAGAEEVLAGMYHVMFRKVS